MDLSSGYEVSRIPESVLTFICLESQCNADELAVQEREYLWDLSAFQETCPVSWDVTSVGSSHEDYPS